MVIVLAVTKMLVQVVNKKIEKIYDGKSDINPYGGTNRAEFFAVVSEYFFERPKLLEKKHPELYKLLEKIFQQLKLMKAPIDIYMIISRLRWDTATLVHFRHLLQPAHQ